MVKYLALIFLLLGLYVWSDEVQIESSIDNYTGVADTPLKGTILITHNKKDSVDANSFSLEGKPLDAALSKEVEIQNGMTVSAYTFTLPAAKPGLYILPTVSVKVAGKMITSPPATYEVTTPSNARTATPRIARRPIKQTAPSRIVRPGRRQMITRKPTPATPQGPILFRLDTTVQAPAPFYPGERAHFMYRISYNRSVDLSESHFPLLKTPEFKEIGDVQIQDYEQGGLTYQDLVKEIQAFKPGTYRYGPASIEGYPYEIRGGQKVYLSDKLHAESPGADIVVSPFPVSTQPASYKGALGDLSVDLKMLTPPEVILGDRIQLELSVGSAINLADLDLPNIACQPGFSGFFDLNDLPPAEKIEGKSKHFMIELRPISMSVQAVPSIEISSFIPSAQQYKKWVTAPIPIHVLPLPPSTQPAAAFHEMENIDIAQLMQHTDIPVSPIKEEPVWLTKFDIRSNLSRTPWVWWLIPLGLLLLTGQRRLKIYWETHPSVVRKKSSRELFKEALSADLTPSEKIQRFKEVLLYKLKEEKQENSVVANMILYLESLQYGREKKFNLEKLQSDLASLF